MDNIAQPTLSTHASGIEKRSGRHLKCLEPLKDMAVPHVMYLSARDRRPCYKGHNQEYGSKSSWPAGKTSSNPRFAASFRQDGQTLSERTDRNRRV